MSSLSQSPDFLHDCFLPFSFSFQFTLTDLFHEVCLSAGFLISHEPTPVYSTIKNQVHLNLSVKERWINKNVITSSLKKCPEVPSIPQSWISVWQATVDISEHQQRKKNFKKGKKYPKIKANKKPKLDGFCSMTSQWHISFC